METLIVQSWNGDNIWILKTSFEGLKVHTVIRPFHMFRMITVNLPATLSIPLLKSKQSEGSTEASFYSSNVKYVIYVEDSW